MVGAAGERKVSMQRPPSLSVQPPADGQQTEIQLMIEIEDTMRKEEHPQETKGRLDAKPAIVLQRAASPITLAVDIAA